MTRRPPSMTYLLPHLLEQSAEDDPNHVALRYRGESLTYRELSERAASLAHALIADGVLPGDRIGILLKKGFESAIALYGIMAAGATYVPLDPASPAARVEFVIRDCGITRIVSDGTTLEILNELAASGTRLTAVFGIDEGEECPTRTVSWKQVATHPTSPPSIRTTEQDLCYVLYTSGSTGTPKGIMHTHRSALAWAELTASVYRISPDDILSNYAPLHFDLSTLDYFGSARSGATTVIIPEEYTRFPASLANLIADERLTILYTVPLALVRLAVPGILAGKDLQNLRLVLFGGEPMPIKHLRTIMGMLPEVEFVNVYGPTETNGCTHHPVVALPDDPSQGLPIGKPYPNVETMIVDPEGGPVAHGEAGELLVRAPTMMRGYWGRPDLNERAFVTRNEHGGLPDVFHATGDIVSLLDDGDLRFLGRRDRQIKARGNRIELDEVESVLLTHPSVHEAAVYPLLDDDDSLQIHAEVILVEGSHAGTDALLGHMREALPTYAVPTTITIRTSFPRTSTGKIDRRTMQVLAAPVDS
jgi:amino acid adenylation domain-containing protein